YREQDANFVIVHQPTADAEADLVGERGFKIGIDRGKDLAVDKNRRHDRRSRLLANLELVVAVQVVPGVLLAVVGVEVDRADTAAASREYVVVAAVSGLGRGLAITGNIVAGAHVWSRHV